MKRLIYTGTAPGQAEVIRIGGAEYRRGETYNVIDTVAADLLRRGGFEVVKKVESADDREEAN